MVPESVIKVQVAAFAFKEAHHLGGFHGMLAVACVLRNRVRRGWFNGDWMAVLNNAGDVAALEPGPEPKLDLASGSFRRVLQEIDDIYTGMFLDELTGKDPDSRDPFHKEGGLYYLDSLYTERNQTLRPWFMEKIIRDPQNHPRIAQVGGSLHIFA